MSIRVTDVRQATGRDSRTLAVRHLGLVPYADAWKIQQSAQDLLIRAKRQGSDFPVPNFLLTVEHPPVYTLGKSGDARNLLLSEEDLADKNVTFSRTDRGGDITYHGPGQLVGYPVLDLDRFFTDIGRYLRTLEEVIIIVCGSYGLSAGRVPGRTGVWLDINSGNERKVCAFGIRCSRWVTMHGFALNVNTELDYYDYIVPCGISDRSVTSLAKELNQRLDPVACRERVVDTFSKTFEAPTFEINASDFDALLGRTADDICGQP